MRVRRFLALLVLHGAIWGGHLGVLIYRRASVARMGDRGVGLGLSLCLVGVGPRLSRQAGLYCRLASSVACT